MKDQPVMPYKKEFDHTYACSAYTVIELLAARPELVDAVYLHPDYNGDEKMQTLCSRHGIPVKRGEVYFRRINQKENTYALGVFRKYPMTLPEDEPHVVLVNPADMGNLGTIVRTLAGFNLRNLAILTPAADVWHPKTIRASMGALFRINIQQFNSLETYRSAFGSHRLFPFMLDGEMELGAGNCPAEGLFSLVFGNESSGLDPRWRDLGMSVRIPQSTFVDSLNLAVAVGVGVFLFMSGYRKQNGGI